MNYDVFAQAPFVDTMFDSQRTILVATFASVCGPSTDFPQSLGPQLHDIRQNHAKKELSIKFQEKIEGVSLIICIEPLSSRLFIM